MDFVLNKLAQPVLVHVDATGLAVVYLALHHSWVGARLHLKARYSVVVDVILLKVTLEAENGKQENGNVC